MASWLWKSLFTAKKNGDCTGKGFGSKRLFALKDSRWFTHDEFNLFKNVLDSGYILELRIANKDNERSVNKDAAATLEYGIVLWMNKPAGAKKQAVVVHLVKGLNKARRTARGLRYSTLESFWCDGTEIRINNMDDGKEKPDDASRVNERVIRASRGFYKWNDSYSFVHWCRYGNPVPVEESTKKRQLHEAAVRWGSVSASAGALLYLSKQQRKHPNASRTS